MSLKIYERIELLLIVSTLDKVIPSIDKIIFLNVSFTLSGNYIIFTTYNNENDKNTTSNVYNLQNVKSYKTL